MAKKTRRGQKQCPKCKAWIKGTRAKTCPKCDHAFVAAKSNGAAPTPVAPAVVEKPSKPGDTITLEQVKKVAHTIQTLGGYQRVTEVLEVIKELGGVKKFKELAEAMSVTDTDSIPY